MKVFKSNRTGTRVRYIDPVTAKVSRWFKVEKPTTPAYDRMTVRELLTLAKDGYGLKVNTKTRKAELVTAITAAARQG